MEKKATVRVTHSAAEVVASPEFKALVKRRWSVSLLLLTLLFVSYYGFILLVAFNKQFLATKISAGAVTSIGIPLGVGVLVFTIVLTAIYVRRANTEFDAMKDEIIKEASK